MHTTLPTLGNPPQRGSVVYMPRTWGMSKEKNQKKGGGLRPLMFLHIGGLVPAVTQITLIENPITLTPAHLFLFAFAFYLKSPNP